MQNLTNIILVVLGAIILGCLLFGCRYRMEGLEDMKTDMPNVDCSTYGNQPACEMYAAQCQWQGADEGGKCMPNTMTEQNVPMEGPDVLPGLEGFSNY